MIPSEQMKLALKAAQDAGAEAVEVIGASGQTLEVNVRHGKLEEVERSEGRDLGIRVFLNGAQASASGSDFSPEGLTTLAERVVAMCKVAPQDPYCGLADKDLWGTAQDLDLADSTAGDADTLEAWAQTAEAEALKNKAITNSFGAGASASRTVLQILTSEGLEHTLPSSTWSCWMTALAERDGAMERDYDWSTERHHGDLKSPESIGQEAARRTVARLGAKRIKTQKAPVIFDNRCATRILGPALEAMSGPAVARGVSFLKDKFGEQIFAAEITITEDPLRKRGHGSSSIDREGVKREKRNLIDKGVLTTWLLNTASAKQLGLTTTGHASWSLGGAPGIAPSNVWLEAGSRSVTEMMADLGRGLLVTDMFGPSLNKNTGDWSVGSAGFWFENGEIVHPVNEITVAGNLLDIYQRLEAASDLEFRDKMNAPSLLVDELAIAGQ